jgi:hypothetical protein
VFRPVAEPSTERPAEVGSVELAVRTVLIFLQIAAAYLLAEQVSPFFYQQF